MLSFHRRLSFFAARLPNTPQHILHDFLRSMNKVWQKREKRKMQRIREAYITQIQDLRRQIQHAKPYRGVIAEKKIRMLKSQVDKERGKRFKVIYLYIHIEYNVTWSLITLNVNTIGQAILPRCRRGSS